MHEIRPFPLFSVAESDALRKKMRSLRWKPDAIMRETVLIQRLREMAVMSGGEG
jgi:hypothetical protein